MIFLRHEVGHAVSTVFGINPPSPAVCSSESSAVEMSCDITTYKEGLERMSTGLKQRAGAALDRRWQMAYLGEATNVVGVAMLPQLSLDSHLLGGLVNQVPLDRSGNDRDSSSSLEFSKDLTRHDTHQCSSCAMVCAYCTLS